MGSSGNNHPPLSGAQPLPNHNLDTLLPEFYDRLRSIARAHLRQERVDHTLQPTALVHEAYLRLAQQRNLDIRCKAQFLIAATNVIRQVLVDHARGRAAMKRMGQRVSVSGLDLEEESESVTCGVDLIDLDEALNRLKELNARAVRVVELRFFGGLSVEETAEALEISPRTVANDSAIARAWLRRELGHSGND